MIKSIRLIFSFFVFASLSFQILAESNSVGFAPAFKKVFIVVLENTSIPEALQQSFLSKLARDGALLSNYEGLARPSQPNYIALVAGSTYGVATNDNVTLDVRHIGNLVEEKGKTWKSYAEGYPGNCFLEKSKDGYWRKHEPFLSFKNITSQPSECAKVVPASQFEKDLAAGSLPDFVLYVPDNKNSGHDTDVAYASKWLEKTFGPLLKNPLFMKDLLFVVTFDEGGHRDQKIATFIVGDLVKRGVRSEKPYSHYSLLRTIEDHFELGSLGQEDLKAREIMNIWNATAVKSPSKRPTH